MSFEQRFNDGAGIHVDSADGKVSVYQSSQGTESRGAAFLSPDDAEQLADAIKAAAAEARGESSQGGSDGEASQEEAAPAS
jgi:hypothetical protein